MDRSAIVFVSMGLALTLVACKSLRSAGDDVHAMTGRAPCIVNVHLDERRKVYVDQEPARTGRCATRTISFFLREPPLTSAMKVRVTGGPGQPSTWPTCTLTSRPPQQAQVDCPFAAANPRGTYKYEVEVTDGQNPPPDKLDPQMIND